MLVQENNRAQSLMEIAKTYEQEIKDLKCRNGNNYDQTHLSLIKSLTCNSAQFKKEIIDKKVRHYKENEENTTKRGRSANRTKKN